MGLSISEGVKARLDELLHALKAGLGEDLVSVVVHGSAARGGWREGTSDVDLVVLLKQAPREKLDAIANALQVARFAARIEAMILTEDEVTRAADVFPLFYGDIVRAHEVVFGSDPFAKLQIAPHHVRLRVEQELREAQIRLRRAVTDGMGAKSALENAVTRKVRQVRSPLHALLGLKQITCDDDLASVVKKSAEVYAVDPGPLLAVEKDALAAHGALTKLLSAAIQDVDEMDTGART